MSVGEHPATLARITTAFAALPARQRAIFLALVDEVPVSYEALATRFGISIAEVEREFAAVLVALAEVADR